MRITDVGVVVAFTPEAGPPFTYTFATCLSLENTFESRGVRGYAGEALAAARARVGKRVQLPLRLAFAASVAQLDKEEGTPLWKLVLQQFDDLLVKILLGAATLSFVLVRTYPYFLCTHSLWTPSPWSWCAACT